MRRSDREITDFETITKIMSMCDVCRLAINEGDYPYIVPLNFGMKVTDKTIKLYFHGANEGKKLELIQKSPHVCFEMDRGHKLMLINDSHDCTMAYQSVIGHGTVRVLEEDEKFEALSILMHHYRADDFGVNLDAMPRTTVFELTVEGLTAKERKAI